MDRTLAVGRILLVAAFVSACAPDDPASAPARTVERGSGEAQGVCPPFPLRDEAGNAIDPVQGVNADAPYSPRQTCGADGCHDYDKITEGFHFQQGRGEPVPAALAERYNWVTSPGNYGGTWCSPAPLYSQLAPKHNTDARLIDMTSFDFITPAGCGNCHPGGGPLELDRDGRRYDAWMRDPASGLTPGGENNLDGDYYKARWSETGVIEADCLLCHMPEYDYAKRNAQLAALNFRWAASAGAGFGTVTGSVKDGADPVVAYDTSRFDERGNVRVHLVPEPRNETCLRCHAKPGWKKRGAAFSARTDVHLAAGMRCVDCHAAGSRAADPRISGREEHQFGKGDDPSGWVRNDLDDTVRSCESCHLDGWHNAPRATHEWLPPLHLDRLACPTCHIPTRAVKSALVQASDVYNAAPRISPPPKHIWTFYDQERAFWNHYGELNLFTQADQPTNVTRPTLFRYRGKIWPGNRVHSTWVGYEEAGKPGLNQLLMRDFFELWTRHRADPAQYPELARITDDDHDGTLEVNRPEEIDALLAATKAYLAATGFPLEGKRLVWVSDSRAFYSSTEARDLPREEWEATAYASVHKFSHDVAPARAALGAGGCRDCHAASSPFFFAPVLEHPFGPDGNPVWTSQASVLGYDGSGPAYSGLPGATAAFFKWLTIVVLGLLLVHIALDLAARLRHRRRGERPASTVWVRRFNTHALAQHLLLMLSVVLLGLSGLFLFGARFPGASWAAGLTGALGGLDFWRVVHRVGGMLLVFVAVYHLVYALVHEEGRRDFRLMLPTLTDFRHLGGNLRFFFGRSDRPPDFGRFTYFEKFDYWAVFWGCVVMILTGGAMWFNDLAVTIFPGLGPEVFDAFKEAHAHEAVLAVLTIAVWHVYNIHLRPGRFPGRATWVHGRVRRDELEQEHPDDPLLRK